MGPSQDGLSCRNIHCGGAERAKERESSSGTSAAGLCAHLGEMLPGYLFQSRVHVHLHLHDEQVRGLDDLLHHLGSVTQDGL